MTKKFIASGMPETYLVFVLRVLFFFGAVYKGSFPFLYYFEPAEVNLIPHFYTQLQVK